MKVRVLDCRDELAARPALREAARVLRDGGLVVFPTETVYGLAAFVGSERGLERLRQVKQRPADKPFSVHIPSPEDVHRYVDVQAHKTLERLVRRTMPGPVTLVVEVSHAMMEEKLRDLGLSLQQAERLYFERTIGLRCPDHAIGAAFLRQVEGPVVASSANPAGLPPPTDAPQAIEALGDRVDLVLDAGPTRYARASTVITVRGREIELQRDGVVDTRYLRKLMKGLILFVCSGNTCRSPMAEAIARHELSLLPGEVDMDVASAGTGAATGNPMTWEAEEALSGLEVPAGAHASQPLTPALVRQAEAIFCMTENHKAAISRIAPGFSAKVQLLDPEGQDIEDPIGAGLEEYVKCAERLRELVRGRLAELGYSRVEPQ